MTIQIPDSLLFSNKSYSLRSEPLQAYLKSIAWRKNHFPLFTNSACSRGYVAKWEIVDDTLRLLEVAHPSEPAVSLIPSIFPGKSGPQLADWFTGELVYDKDELSATDLAAHLPVQDGKVVGLESVHVPRFNFEDLLTDSPEPTRREVVKPRVRGLTNRAVGLISALALFTLSGLAAHFLVFWLAVIVSGVFIVLGVMALKLALMTTQEELAAIVGDTPMTPEMQSKIDQKFSEK